MSKTKRRTDVKSKYDRAWMIDKWYDPRYKGHMNTLYPHWDDYKTVKDHQKAVANFHSDSYWGNGRSKAVKEFSRIKQRADMKQQLHKAMRTEDYEDIYINNKIETIGYWWYYD